MPKDEVDEKKGEILYVDEDGNIHVIDKEIMQLELFKTKDLKPNKKGGQIKRKRSKKKPKGWGKARYKGAN
tara:strand:+ start:45 stop:257 length:213 start_codon:yes stop_codon:yes gene_type:complete